MRIPQQWFSVEHVSMLLGFSRSTIREWVRQGKFGPAPDQPPGDYVISIGTNRPGGDVRISTRALFHFLDNAQPITKPIIARTEGECRRKLNAE